MDARELQKRSSATTLSDMEMFIFPELIYSLVLANIMSPRIWRWRDDPWFDGLERMNPYRRITRLKQYIMDHYVFNLDLETWGLTTQEQEIARFESFLDRDTLAKSNALFGYEGDKYYFDIDIRTHFGLDQVGDDVIPFWKTETIEAMDAFQFREGYTTGAGECVSLATLYAAALFVVARIPLSDIFLMATPLHSQNFVDVNGGVLINNRRLVTKNMWFNGTALSGQARRALENERVTIVAHETGVIHTLYPEATIAPEAYAHFGKTLRDYLVTPLTPEILGNFLRQNHHCQKCFVLRYPLHGRDHYIPMNRVFAYEHGSPYRVTDNTRDKMMAEIEQEEFSHQFCPGAIVLNDVEEFVRTRQIDLDKPEDVAALKAEIHCICIDAESAIDDLVKFCHVRPNLPQAPEKTFQRGQTPLGIDVEMSREEVIDRLDSLRGRNELARLAFYAYRDLSRVEAAPYLEACLTRNPVSAEALKMQSEADLIATVAALTNISIYDDPGRLAQPDEVWNFLRGDGLERAVLVANVLRAQGSGGDLAITIADGLATLRRGAESVCAFETAKTPQETVWDLGDVAQG